MKRRVLTGFDSAWTHRNRGAIASLITERGKHTLEGPVPASFDEALDHIRKVGRYSEVHAIAIDQPLVVENETGRRPVEQVVSHVMGKFRSAVQPANRQKAEMFGDLAPIRTFLQALQNLGYHHDHHIDDRETTTGLYFFEVYPALGNLGLFPIFHDCGHVPKYNPGRKTFKLDDWRSLCQQVRWYLESHGIECKWANSAPFSEKPKKAQQDQLDSLICLCHALSWTDGEDGVVVGSFESGYMVVPSHEKLTVQLREYANEHGIPFAESCLREAATSQSRLFGPDSPRFDDSN